jgi:hypothetical protein
MGVDIAAAATALADKFIHDAPAKAYDAGRAAGYQEGYTAGQIAQFAVGRPDFETLRPKMAALQTADPSMPLEWLYDEARWTDPLIREEEIMKRQAQQPTYRNGNGARPISQTDRARMASKATIGSPSSSPKPTSGHSIAEYPEADVRAALARQRGG